MVYIREFEFVEDEGYVLAFPFGMEGGTEGTDLLDAVKAASEWLQIHALNELENGRELPQGTLGNKPRRGGMVLAVTVTANLADVPAVTAVEAASMLGVSPARVKQLCDAGDLTSWTVGRTRMVSRDSVEYRLASEPKAGRPRRAAAVS